MTRIFWLPLYALLLAAGCAPPESTGIALRIYFTPPGTSDALRAEDAPPAGTIPPYISSFRICVSASDMKNPACKNFSVDDYDRKGKARIDGLKVGDDRRVTFQGYDLNDPKIPVYWCGEIEGVKVEKDQTTRVSMFITACRDFSVTRGPMSSPRVFHTATRLYNGKVLIVGGFSVAAAYEANCDGAGACQRLTATPTIDIFDPRTGQFESYPELQLIHPRGLHTATKLPDGRVFIAGGCQNAIWRVGFPGGPGPLVEVDGTGGWGSAGTIAEIINPDARTSEEVFAAMPTRRAQHAAIPLPSGDVALAGGFSDNNVPLGSAALYQTASGEFIDVPFLKTPRRGMTVAPYGGAGDRFLVWGGNHPPSPGPGTFAEIVQIAGDDVSTREPPFVSAEAGRGLPAFYAAGAELSSGNVLVTGGMVLDTNFDPGLAEPRALDAFRVIGLQPEAEETIAGPENPSATMGHFFAFHTATRLDKKSSLSDPDTKVMVAGGFTPAAAPDLLFEPQDKVIFYVPWEQDETRAFTFELVQSRAVSLSIPRAGHTATPLEDATILIAGGFTGSPELSIAATAEIFNPDRRELRPE